MPRQEFGFQAGNARFKFMELVSTAHGVYLIFPIPEMKMHLSFHYPNEQHDSFGAFLRVPGIKRSYTLDLDEDILTVNNLLRRVDSFTAAIESGYSRYLDDSERARFVVVDVCPVDPLVCHCLDIYFHRFTLFLWMKSSFPLYHGLGHTGRMLKIKKVRSRARVLN